MRNKMERVIQRFLPNDSSPDIQQKISAALMTQVYKQGHIGIFASFICSTILFYGLFPITDHFLLFSWYVVSFLICAGRYVLIHKYFQQPPTEINLASWRGLYIFGAFLGGASWGFVCSILFPYPNVMIMILSIFMLAGVTAGAVPVLSGILSSAIVFLAAAILPLNIRLLFIGAQPFLLYDLALFVYLWYLILLSIRSYKATAHVISLQFENDALLDSLSNAKNELESINKKLAHSASHDHLTDLGNRGLFGTLFDEAIQTAKHEQKILALLYIDIDHFKEANDAYGHQIGDLLLKSLVMRIKDKLPQNAVATRFGSDEITVIFENIKNTDEIAELAQELCKAVITRFEIKDYNILTSVSIGISVYPVDGRDAETLLKNADKALHVAKSKGGNCFHFNTELSASHK